MASAAGHKPRGRRITWKSVRRMTLGCVSHGDQQTPDPKNNNFIQNSDSSRPQSSISRLDDIHKEMVVKETPDLDGTPDVTADLEESGIYKKSASTKTNPLPANSIRHRKPELVEQPFSETDYRFKTHKTDHKSYENRRQRLPCASDVTNSHFSPPELILEDSYETMSPEIDQVDEDEPDCCFQPLLEPVQNVVSQQLLQYLQKHLPPDVQKHITNEVIFDCDRDQFNVIININCQMINGDNQQTSTDPQHKEEEKDSLTTTL